MLSLNRRLTLAFVPGFGKDESRETRTRVGTLEAWVSILGNSVLFVVKFLMGMAISSISLIADAFHTLSDVISSIVVLVGFRMSGAEADKEHPYGHGRVEHVATLVIAVLLVMVGFEFLSSSVSRLFHPQKLAGSWIVVAVVLFSGLVKEWMAGFSIFLGRAIDSSALMVDAWHHRSDAIASVLVGVALVASLFGYYWVDAVFGIMVSGLIIFTGIGFGRSSGSALIGESPDEKTVADCQQAAYEVEGVQAVHDLWIHLYGDRKVISLHIEVDPALTLLKAHQIADRVECSVSQRLHADVTVHVDPLEKAPAK